MSNMNKIRNDLWRWRMGTWLSFMGVIWHLVQSLQVNYGMSIMGRQLWVVFMLDYSVFKILDELSIVYI